MVFQYFLIWDNRHRFRKGATIVSLFIVYLGTKLEFGMYFLIGGGLCILWYIYKIIERRNNLWTVTNFRVIDEYGVFSNNSKESPLDKINNVSYRQPLIGRIFGYGDVQIQTAAEEGATIHRMVENPRSLKDTITKYQDQNVASAAGVGQQTSKTDISEELIKLHDLVEKGILTEEEFNQRKAKVLNR